MDMHGDFSFPTDIVFGAGRIRELPERTQGWGSLALVVTDPGVAGSGVVQRVLDVLAAADRDFRVFEDVAPNPTAANVEAGVHRYREGCDHLIAVGGGSVIDAAKAIALAATHEGQLARYDDLKGG